MEPPSDSVVSGSGAGPSLGTIANDEHIVGEPGRWQRGARRLKSLSI